METSAKELEIIFDEKPEQVLNGNREFVGQKVCHPFAFETVEKPVTYTFKRRGKTIKKTTIKKSSHYSSNFLDAEVEADVTGADRFEIKFDGGCGLALLDPESKTFTVYARYDVKKDAKTGDWKERGENWIACEPKPTIPEANHWPHFRPCYEDPKGYRWFIEAFKKLEDTGFLQKVSKSFTFELMGKKVNFCKTDPIEENSVIIPHGLATIDIPKEFRNYEGFKKVFEQVPHIEGVVVYAPSGKVYKVRRDMYRDEKGVRMAWPNGTPDDHPSLGGEGLASKLLKTCFI